MDTDTLTARQVGQLLQLLQWDVADEQGGLLRASAKYGADRLIFCPPLHQENLPKAIRKMKPSVPDWIVVPDRYDIDKKRLTPLSHLGVDKVMRPWQFMDSTFRSFEQAAAILEEPPDDDADVEPRSYRGVHEQYIPQSYQGDQQGDNSLELCMNLQPADNGLLLMVLAQAGYGKTWLTKAYNYAAAKRYVEFPGHRVASQDGAQSRTVPPIPFLIPFGEYRKLASINGIVRERMEDIGVPEYTSAAFQYLLSKGRLVLILDGFDELLESSPNAARENLREIQQAIQGRGIMVLTSRTTFFRSQPVPGCYTPIRSRATRGDTRSV